VREAAERAKEHEMLQEMFRGVIYDTLSARADG